MPLLVSLQNTVQGFLVSEGRTWGINQAAGIGVIVMLGVADFGTQSGQNRADAAALGKILGVIMEISYLFYSWHNRSAND